ncbi:MAG TPA: DUF1850 domain-containing protein [Burkholderiaceae bacterium]|nr:DUF1850 domain-containing protein [Burkholderiaceae bacterium]
MPAAVAAVAMLVASAAAATEPPCRLELSEQRTGAVLAQLPLPPRQPQFAIAFEHSVLGHTVIDRYELRGERAHLIEERFSGEGYGLPHAAAPGERLGRNGDAWTLALDRIVDPLVVRPLRDQRMRLRIGERELLLADLTARPVPILIRPLGCDRS